MKKNSFPLLCNLFTLCFCFSCSQLHHGTSLSISESRQDYKLQASFDKSKTRNVEEYMDDQIGKRSNMSFINTHIDGKLALDDHTTFYINKYPGYLEIKFNKDENSTASYIEIKDLAEGLKKVIN